MNLEITEREKKILQYTLVYSYNKLDKSYRYTSIYNEPVEYLEKYFGSFDELDTLMNKLFKKG